MAFHHQADQAFALWRRLGQELLGGGEDRFLIGADLDLRDRFDGDGDALLGVEVLLRRNIKATSVQATAGGCFPPWGRSPSPWPLITRGPRKP